MADESRPDVFGSGIEESLARYWNALGHEAQPDHSAIDPSLVDTVAHVHQLGAARPPEPEFVRRLRDELFLTGANATATIQLNGDFRLNGRNAPLVQQSVTTTRLDIQGRRWRFATGAVAVLLALLGAGYVLFGSGLLDDDQPDTVPAAVAPTPTPTPDVRSEGTIVEITIPAEVLPAGVAGSALDHNTILPGTLSTWTVPQNAILRYVTTGTLTIRSDTPVSLLRAGTSTWMDVGPDTEVELGPGDAVLFLNATTAEFENASTNPVELVGWIIESGTGSDGPLPAEWVNNTYALSGAGGVSLTGEPAVMQLRRMVMAPGDTIPAPPEGVLQLVIAMSDNGAGTPVGTPLVMGQTGGKITNYGAEPTLVYMLTLSFVVPKASPAVGTPAP